MKKALFTILIIQACAYGLMADDEDHRLFRKLLTDLDELVSSDKKTELAKKFLMVKDKTLEKKLVFYIDEKMGDSVFSGAGFSPVTKDSPVPYIMVSTKLVKIYDTKPSIAMSIVMHEFIHAWSYFVNPDYFIFYNRKNLDKYLYEFDALYYEAYFINKYLVKRGYTLTTFERVLNDFFKKDTIDVFSLYYHARDYRTAFDLYKIRISNKSNDEKVSAIAELGNELLKSNKIEQDDDGYVKFAKYTTLLTYYNFAPQTVFDIFEMKEETAISVKNFSISNYPSIFKVYNEIDGLIGKKELRHCEKIQKEFFDKVLILD